MCALLPLPTSHAPYSTPEAEAGSPSKIVLSAPSESAILLTMTDGKLLWRLHPQANVSLHALARRIERGHKRDHAALLRDLAVLADAGEEGERVDTGEGSWFGPVIDADDQGRRIRMRNVRSWLPTDCGQANRRERRPAQFGAAEGRITAG
jgi:hypothetical protein